nr:low temperature requirement protein A [Micromonospora sp. DSM 115978]
MADRGRATPPALRGRLLVARVQGADDGVSRIELFIDLFFVFAFLRVTDLMADRFGPAGVIEGSLLVLMLWHCWTSCAWLGNVVHPDKGAMPLLVFGIATALLVMGVAIPGTFASERVTDPLLVGSGYLLILYAVLAVLTYVNWPKGRAGRRPAIASWATYLPAGVILIGGILIARSLPLPIDERHLRIAVFALVIVINFSALRVVSSGTAHVISPRHLAERHGLVILVALGETIISVGITQGPGGDRPITWQLLAGAMLSIAVVAALWWCYFDVSKVIAEQAMLSLSQVDRSRLARDAYSGLHLPMIGGLLVLAFGLKLAVSAASGATEDPWRPAVAILLFGGVVLYLAGLVGFQLRAWRRLGRSPVVGIALLVVLAPLAANSPPLGSLLLLVLGVAGMVVADRTVFRRRHRTLHRQVEPEVASIGRVTPKELLADLVYVFAFIQVTVLMVRQDSALGVLQGLILIALLWWAWTSFAWVIHSIRHESDVVRVGMICVMAATLTLGIALPQTFEPVPGGLPGASVVLAAYLAGRLVHTVLIWHVAREQPQLPAMIRQAAVPGGVAFILLVGSLVLDLVAPDHAPTAVIVTVIWLVAVVIEIGGCYRIGIDTWRIRNIGHWTDRYALIMLIAFGETVISLGLAGSAQSTSLRMIALLTSATVAICTIWWSYFSTDAPLARQALETTRGADQARLSRDAYTYLHLPMVAGLMLFAFGLRQSLELHDRPALTQPYTIGHYALYLGAVVYLVSNQAFWWRVWRRLSPYRAAGAVLVAALAPLTTSWPLLWSMVLLAGLGLAFELAGSRRTATTART